jgi:hypothetical protein
MQQRPFALGVNVVVVARGETRKAPHNDGTIIHISEVRRILDFFMSTVLRNHPNNS